ncbi:ABC transporter permease subunit [Cyanobacterium stanieri LEGE 03274]|uniref:ABC transporter permease subunit n=1 Tax=Cyanobacterium stanieri LEGE 03274 TaxID=1828756 RepID=A0ABR9V6B3_9CHRO|nr:ABC transporter permease [Cyanobacterium stanieri]MBE9223437.1 ABC transporter permease subunit [Cyanobacterium stanieri LEGE 03274]
MKIFNNIIAIFQKELQGYFNSPLALAIASIFWLISGIFFLFILFSEEGIIQNVALQEQLGNTSPRDVPYEFIQVFFGIMGSITIFLLPMLSMGLYSEERKIGTIELLATSPVFNWVVAVGKLLGVVVFYITMIVPILLYEAIAFSTSNPPIPPAVPLLAHMGLILLASAILSLGMFISSLTESTIFSAIITFVLVIFISILDALTNNIQNPIGEFINQLSVIKSYEEFVQGIFTTSSLIIFFSYIILGLFLTAQSIETLRFTRK